MSFSGFDIFSLIFSSIAFGSFANGLIARSLGRSFPRVLLTIALIVIAFILRFILNYHGPLQTLMLTLRDAGAGMIVGGIFARMYRAQANILVVPGIVSLLGAVGLWVLITVFGFVQKTVTHSLEGWFRTDENKVQLLVELGEDDEIKEITPTLEKYAAKAERAFPYISMNEDSDLAQYFLVTVDEKSGIELMNALKEDVENIDSAEPNLEVPFIAPHSGSSRQKSRLPINDPEAGKQWALQSSGLSQAFDQLSQIRPRKKAKIAIIDTGIDGRHEDLEGIIDLTSEIGDPQGHGTHCAGVAGAIANNGLGIASCNLNGKFIELSSYKALNARGMGTVQSIAGAISKAADDGVQVISLSLGGHHPQPPKAEVDAIEYAIKQGCIVVVAAGNSDSDASEYAPANIPGVIVVAATDDQDLKAEFSNTNASLQYPIAAPGVNILSLKTGGGYVSMSGTSMATPLVAGVVGLLKSVNPKMTVAECHTILKQTGKDITDSPKVGKLIQAHQALKKVID